MILQLLKKKNYVSEILIDLLFSYFFTFAEMIKIYFYIKIILFYVSIKSEVNLNS